MCTALTLISKDNFHFFGRNMDLEYNFNQSALLVPRNFSWKNVIDNSMSSTKYAVLGIGTIIDNHPLFADGFNEKGLACAGLNFPHYCDYSDKIDNDKVNIGPYDLIFWILSNFETVSQVKSILENINIVGKNFNQFTPLPTLHWIVYDSNDDCIIIEKTKDKFSVYDNNIGVLTNSPTFDWHINNLNQFAGLSSMQPETVYWHKHKIEPIAQGLGLFGIPGDFYSSSRFVRASFLKSHASFLEDKESTLSEFFHILNNVAMVAGSVVTKENKNDLTLYTSCMCLESGIYYYNTYNNAQINSIEMFKEDLNGKSIKVFELIDIQSINPQN